MGAPNVSHAALTCAICGALKRATRGTPEDSPIPSKLPRTVTRDVKASVYMGLEAASHAPHATWLPICSYGYHTTTGF